MTRTRIETTCPCGTSLVYRNIHGVESIDVSFLLNDKVRYQPLNWRMRMARTMYYLTLKRFYKQLRRNGVTQRSLHYLAGGAHRERHGGWALGSQRYMEFQAWLSVARNAIALSQRHLQSSTQIAAPMQHPQRSAHAATT